MVDQTLAGLRTSRGYTQESLAEAVGASQGSVKRWERGKTIPQPWLRQPLAEALQVSLADLDRCLGTSSTGPALAKEKTHSTSEGSEGSTVWDEPADVWRRVRQLEQTTVGQPELELFAARIRQVVDQYEQDGPLVLAPQAARLRARLHGLLDEHQRLAQRVEVTRLGAQTAGLLGYMAVNTGQFRLSEAYCAEALHLAGDCGDLALQQWVRGTQSLGAYYQGRYGLARDYAQAGCQLAPQHPQAIRLLINGQARAAGKLGDYRDAHAAVGRGLELLSYHDVPAELTPCLSFAPYGYARAAANAATAYVALGDVDQVLSYTGAVEPAVEHADSDWSRALVRLDIATALLQQRSPDLEQAVCLGREALRASADRPIRSVWQRMTTVAELAARWPNHPAVSEFTEALRTWQTAPAVRAITPS